MPSLLDTLESLFATRDLYQALGFQKLEKDCDRKSVTEGQIRKAYHKSSLKYHPDRSEEKDRKEATKKFQALGATYKILSDANARALYDESGEIDEENGGFDDNRDWDHYWRLLFQKVSYSYMLQRFHKRLLKYPTFTYDRIDKYYLGYHFGHPKI